MQPLVVNAKLEIGHFNGGVMNMRDYVMPEPGFYGAMYNYFYTTGQLNKAGRSGEHRQKVLNRAITTEERITRRRGSLEKLRK